MPPAANLSSSKLTLRDFLDKRRVAGVRQHSLRLWLQSSTLIAVLAGYGVLMGVGAGLTVLERRANHQQLVNALAERLADGSNLSLESKTSPSTLQIELIPLTANRPAQQVKRGDQTWIESSLPLRRPGQKPITLEVRQNITASVQRERTLQLLLIAAAGLASLFTSALLRPVLRRGLVNPIETFCAQLQQISTPTTPVVVLPETEQPSELQPIAATFNALQQRLAAAWERERSFTNGVAHELRTPITLISGQAESLLRQPLPVEQHQTLESIAREAQHMGNLVRDLLDLARCDSGRLELMKQSVDPEAVVLDTFDRLRPLAPTRLTLAPANDTPLPPVEADRERLMQCLTALINNALAYSPTGPVELALSNTATTVTWHVRDCGPGITAADQAQIFKRFARGSAAVLAPAHRGSGLGLALVTLLMEAMGGRVSANNRPQGGADFQLQLPAKRSCWPAKAE